MSFPDVSDAFWGFTTAQKFSLITKVVTDHEVVETGAAGVVFDGAMEPTPPQKLLVKPEGQRSWKWWTLWTTVKLSVDDVIVDEDLRRFRVMSVSDWHQGGHYQYELTEGATPTVS